MILRPSIADAHRIAHPEPAPWLASMPAADWLPPLAERVRQNTQRLAKGLRAPALQELEEVRRARSARRVRSDMPDAELRQMARERAEECGRRIDETPPLPDAGVGLAWLNAQVQDLDARPFRFEGERKEADQLRGFQMRARCDLWWRRQLRRAAVRLRECEACAAGEVSATSRQPYVTNDTARRLAERARANAEMLQAARLENDAGQSFTIAELAEKSPANPAIRRGELMTRIRGCEELAESQGLRGVFLTMTAPSRFHPVLRHGAKNPRHDGSTPRDAHLWLCATWAKARARLARIGVTCYGFRVAEPHHDGTPHWHALLWAPPGKLWRLVLNLRRWWLRDGGDEPGAREHRCKAILMVKGGASGYVAKYIAKGIDDAGAVGEQGHRDDDYSTQALPEPDQGELFGGTAARVKAWAAAWGIRQFQAIGQPPVTVWRELRRVKAQGGAGHTLRLAFEAVNRDAGRRADWALYVIAQGGPMRGRDYRVRIARQVIERDGRYERAQVAQPVGVYDALQPAVWWLSDRSQWKPREAWGSGPRRVVPPMAAPRAPWTRVINCTRATLIDGRVQPRGAPLKTWLQLVYESEPGEVHSSEHHQHDHPPDPGRHPGGHSRAALDRLSQLRAYQGDRGAGASTRVQ